MKSIVAVESTKRQELFWRHCGIGLALVLSSWFGGSLTEAAAPRGLPGKSLEPVISVGKLPTSPGAKQRTTRAPRVKPLMSPHGASHPKAAGAQVASPATTNGNNLPSAPALTVSFAGVDDSRRYQPADPSLAAGPNHIVQGVNLAWRVTNKTGGNAIDVDPEVFFAQFFTSNPDMTGLSDPWVLYDHFAGRFLLTWIAYNDAFTKGFYLIQASKTSDPTGAWDIFSLRSDIDGAAVTGAAADYPKLGFDNTNFYVTSNQFGASGFTEAKIRVMAKSQFYSPTGPIEWTDFINVKDSIGEFAFTIQPCVTFGTPGKGYLVSAPDGGGNYLALFSITGTWPNATNTLPTMAVDQVNYNVWSSPDEQVQPGGGRVDGSDGRLLNAVYRNGVIYTGHSVKAGGFNCAAGIKAINVSTKTKILDEVIGATNEYFSYPMVTADVGNNVYTVFNRSSSSVFIECRYSVKTPADATFQATNILKAGTGADTGNRWGDYNGIAIDPANGSVWINSMYAVNGSYGTWVGNIGAGGGGSDSQVTATLSSLTLTLTGDGEKNEFTVTHNPTVGTLVITAATGTKVNGKSSETFTGLGRNRTLIVNGDLGGGDDKVTFAALHSSTFHLLLGDGNDLAIFKLCTIYDFFLDGGAGVLDAFVNMGSTLGINKRHSKTQGFP